jgi:flagellar basal-body rod modification protein FlgD
MAASAQGIWNQFSSNSTESKLPSAKANSTQQESSSGGSTATIAANDFLTLLVTEMKNQDPTATTDPNEYVNQLVQVNSLQQLISINETLQNATTLKATTDSAATTSSGRPTSAEIARHAAASAPASSIDIPKTKTAALRVATALGSR